MRWIKFNGKINTMSISSSSACHSVFINVQENMAAGARRINMELLFSNLKLLSIHSESVPRCGSKASAFSHAEKKALSNHLEVPEFYRKVTEFIHNPLRLFRYVVLNVQIDQSTTLLYKICQR